METGFAQPVFGCRVVVELAVVSVGRFLGLEAFEGAVFPEVYFVVVIDRNGTRADSLVGKASVMKIRQGCSEAVGPSQEYLPALRFIKALKGLGLFFEEGFQSGLSSRSEQYVDKIFLGV